MIFSMIYYNIFMSTTHLQLIKKQTICDLIEEIQAKEHSCPQCLKSFIKLSHYNRHYRQTHTQSRDHTCKEPDCGKSFKRGSHLKRHMITHTNIKNYKCPDCIMSFGYKHHLDRHIKVIHLCERLECAHCGLKFKKRKNYNRHIAKAHQKNRRINKQAGKQKQTDTYTVTKTIEESIKQDIYDSSDLEDQIEKGGQRLLFRCHFENCLSAFEGIYEFNRHLQQIHSHTE